jgi:hypothetical protein
MFFLRNHLRRRQAVDLSPDEAWSRRDRVTMPTSSADDRERFAHLMRGTPAVTDHRRAEAAALESSSPQRLSPDRNAQRQRQVAKAARRRQRRECSAR